MDWTYAEGNIEDINLEDWFGFIYIVENLTNNKKYIGQKQFWFTRKVPKKNKKTGKIRKETRKVESDWKTYYGSSPEVKEDVAKLGEENFSRTILKLCKSSGIMNYEELKEQIFRGVLESDEYYNGIIQVRIHKSHVLGRKKENG